MEKLILNQQLLKVRDMDLIPSADDDGTRVLIVSQRDSKTLDFFGDRDTVMRMRIQVCRNQCPTGGVVGSSYIFEDGTVGFRCRPEGYSGGVRACAIRQRGV